MKDSGYVLWLPAWFPDKLAPFDGDFIERHAVAAALYWPVIVLYVRKDPSMKKNVTRVEWEEGENRIVVKAYYGMPGKESWLGRIRSFLKFQQLQRNVWKEIRRRFGSPSIVHVHIAHKQGLLAVDLKRKEKIPYVVTENWTGFYRESVPNIYEQNPALQRISKKILSLADRFLPVTRDLGETVNRDFVKAPYEVVPNVVDTRLFYYAGHSSPVFRFVHASYLNYQKNPEGILEVAARLTEKGHSFELIMIGRNQEPWEQWCRKKGLLNKTVFFTGEMPYPEVAEAFRKADCFLLFSRFENLPCVILEALCTGLPVVSSDTGGIREVVDVENGILVPGEDTQALTAAMESMMAMHQHYLRKEIAEKATAFFSYETVGKMFSAIYDRYKKS